MNQPISTCLLSKLACVFFFLFQSTFYVFSTESIIELENLKKVVEKNPNDTLLIFNMIEFVSKKYRIENESLVPYYSFIIESSEKIGYTNGIAYGNYHLGGHSTNIGKYSEALSYLFTAEKAYLKLNKPQELALIYNCMGNVYLGLKNNEGQKSSYQKCYDIGLKHKLPKFQAYGSAGLANYFTEIKKFKEALKWNKISSKLFLEIGNSMGYVVTQTNMVGALRELGELEQAEKILKDIEKQTLALNFNYASFGFYLEKGLISNGKKKFIDAINSFKIALNLMLEDKANDNISIIYRHLATTAYSAKMYKESSDYFQKHILYKDSVFNEISNKHLLEVQGKYESEKKELLIDNLSKSNALEKLKRKEQEQRSQYLIYGILLTAILAYSVFRRYKSSQEKNAIIAQQKLIVEEKNTQIIDSINYAQKIQQSLLTNEAFLTNYFPNHSLFFKPKDIVSGDFYWAALHGNHFFIAICDSTGHGVPGAFMSLLNTSFLNEAILEKNIISPNLVLDYVRTRLEESMPDGNDGMDATLVRFEMKNESIDFSREIEFSAANNAPVLFRKNEIFHLEKDHCPVGKSYHLGSFTLFKTLLQKGDRLFLFTDGFPDQFGGAYEKKYKTSQLMKFIQAESINSFQSLRASLDTEFETWKGTLEQIDDVCLFGFEV